MITVLIIGYIVCAIVVAVAVNRISAPVACDEDDDMLIVDVIAGAIWPITVVAITVETLRTLARYKE